jgi:hypothetical protein
MSSLLFVCTAMHASMCVAAYLNAHSEVVPIQPLHGPPVTPPVPSLSRLAYAFDYSLANIHKFQVRFVLFSSPPMFLFFAD